MADGRDEHTAGGRPSGNTYHRNPRVEVTLSAPSNVIARLTLPTPMPVPINLTVFKRGTGAALGDLVATSGPYVERVSGVSPGRHKAGAGVYVLVPSTYNATVAEWALEVWSDTPFSAEVCGRR